MKVADLFCGCGGLSLGAQKAGMDVVIAYDNWDAALAVYNSNFSHKAEKEDISNIDKIVDIIKVLSCDGIIGGPPCQDFSSAGHRKEGDRANLTKAFSSIVSMVKCKFFIMENVSRTMKSNTFHQARDTFKKAGYGLTEVVLDASLCGVPQSRKRFFCIGVLGEHDNVLIDLINSRLSDKKMTVRDYFQDTLGIEHYYRHPRNYNRRAIYSIDEPSATIRGVNRPVPVGYPGHPNDSAPLSEKIRELTTKERSMIQTFPDNYIWKGNKTNVEQMIGNAVPVNLAAFISKCVYDFLLKKNSKRLSDMLLTDEKENFRSWLIDVKNINKKVAGNILSRTNRVSGIININDTKPTSHLILDLVDNADFKNLTMCVRSQLKRSVLLYREFKKI